MARDLPLDLPDAGQFSELVFEGGVAGQSHDGDDDASQAGNPLQGDEDKEEKADHPFESEAAAARDVLAEGGYQAETIVYDSGHQPQNWYEAEQGRYDENHWHAPQDATSVFSGKFLVIH